jgi:hypothetical protein
MLTALISLVIAISGLVLILLGVVVAGIRREPPAAELNSRPRSPISAMARRLTGVYVRRPDSAADDADNPLDACLAGRGVEGDSR